MEVAVITGSGSGIGLATAKLMHAAGMAVMGVGRDKGKLADLEREIGQTDRLLTMSIDVTSQGAAEAVIGAARERFGGIHYLVNNAGAGSPKPVDETDDAMLDNFLDLMLLAPCRFSLEAVKHMKPGASIVNVTSVFSMIGGRRGGAYSAAKGGLKEFTEHMAQEYGPQGIRWNNVAPGVTMTDMIRHRLDDEGFKRTNVEMTPYPRLAEPEDVASVIGFLCSPSSEAINGQTIVVDGGWTTTKYLSPRAMTTEWVEQPS